ncbi:hypothetical protein PIB30_091090 [Stylosanthes scabra]|uniref:Uncharacterized protein n=1 Tax=Stylosanthes scabra TaxID=79078 RepID=A0ABU6TU22_9FABA|nr:hypothetical protein [Stylosanthes scabra]
MHYHMRQRLGANPRRVRCFCEPTPRKRIGELHKAEMKRPCRLYCCRKDKVPKRPPPRLVDPEDASTCSGLDVREHITLMNWEIQQQAEEYKREMEAWKKWYETYMTCLQTTLDTQSAKFN